jgi:uncharacterized protein YgiM (DUF1202 family)
MRKRISRQGIGLVAVIAALAGGPAPVARAGAPPPQGHRACDGVVAVSVTNVRTGPGLEYDVAMQLPYGERVIAVGLDLTARWYVAYLPRENNSEPRWIFRQNLRITRQCIKAMSVATEDPVK